MSYTNSENQTKLDKVSHFNAIWPSFINHYRKRIAKEIIWILYKKIITGNSFMVYGNNIEIITQIRSKTIRSVTGMYASG